MIAKSADAPQAHTLSYPRSQKYGTQTCAVFFMLRGQDLNLKEARGMRKRTVSPFRYKKMYENA